MCKPKDVSPILVLPPSCSPFCGIVLYKQILYIYILISEQIHRIIARTANGSIYIFSIYHRLTHAHSPTEIYRRPLVGFPLIECYISNHRRPIAGVSLSERVMTSQ